MEHRFTGVLSKLLSQSTDKLPAINSTGDIEKPQFHEDMSAEVYHAMLNRIGSSGIKKLLHSPRHFLTYWSGLDDEEEKDHFRIGRASHLMLLEPKKFLESYVIEPIHQGVTKDGKPTTSANAESVKAAKALWRAQQKPDAVIVSEEELTMLTGMIEAVLEHPVAAGMLKNGKPECSITWTDPDTGVMCKARPDYLAYDGDNLHLIDFKTTRDIRAGLFANDAYRMKYNTQLAFYHDGIVQALGKQPTSITIIAVEKKPPFEAAVYPLEDKWFEKGQEEYRHALRLYKKCRETGKFPAYQNTAQLLSMPIAANFDSLPEFNWK